MYNASLNCWLQCRLMYCLCSFKKTKNNNNKWKKNTFRLRIKNVQPNSTTVQNFQMSSNRRLIINVSDNGWIFYILYKVTWSVQFGRRALLITCCASGSELLWDTKFMVQSFSVCSGSESIGSSWAVWSSLWLACLQVSVTLELKWDNTFIRCRLGTTQINQLMCQPDMIT